MFPGPTFASSGTGRVAIDRAATGRAELRSGAIGGTGVARAGGAGVRRVAVSGADRCLATAESGERDITVTKAAVGRPGAGRVDAPGVQLGDAVVGGTNLGTTGQQRDPLGGATVGTMPGGHAALRSTPVGYRIGRSRTGGNLGGGSMTTRSTDGAGGADGPMRFRPAPGRRTSVGCALLRRTTCGCVTVENGGPGRTGLEVDVPGREASLAGRARVRPLLRFRRGVGRDRSRRRGVGHGLRDLAGEPCRIGRYGESQYGLAGPAQVGAPYRLTPRRVRQRGRRVEAVGGAATG